jgi:mono/diheme cytochrome c family protein
MSGSPPQRLIRTRTRSLGLAFAILSSSLVAAHSDDPPSDVRSGGELYRAGCVSCHGVEGKGAPRSQVGFDAPLPDFTDCKFATPEPDADWDATIHLGGSARAFDRTMPAFIDALTDEDISSIIAYLRTFCGDRRWPRGDLNLPRPLVTEKAFPENEAVLTTNVSANGTSSIGNAFAFERRVGARGQYEVVVPIDFTQGNNGLWNGGLGDVAVAFKQVLFHSLDHGSIVSAGGEVTLPTGKEHNGLGGGVTVLEPFVAFGQMLPHDGFVHVHAGFELPTDHSLANNESYWRVALGKTFAQGRWGRAWSPMVELLGARELVEGEPAEWDLLPQLQVTLSKRQHVMVNGGLRLPLNARVNRSPSVVVYCLWDWFDGGFFEGWR